MSMQTALQLALVRLTNAVNNADSKTGTLASLTTTDKTSLVAALNEVKAAIQSPTSVINDAVQATGSTWSSSKINTTINNALIALLGGADSSSDTLKELADQIAALVQADNGLLSFAASQTLTVGQQLTGCTNLGIGDPAHNYITAIEAALNPGL
jgi:hypothetical protein